MTIVTYVCTAGGERRSYRFCVQLYSCLDLFEVLANVSLWTVSGSRLYIKTVCTSVGSTNVNMLCWVVIYYYLKWTSRNSTFRAKTLRQDRGKCTGFYTKSVKASRDKQINQLDEFNHNSQSVNKYVNRITEYNIIKKL
jgi:hypothetical protein